MIKGTGFEIIIASPPAYDELVAEIYYNGLFVALINQEAGKGIFELETPDSHAPENFVLRKVKVKGFLQSIEDACHRLSEEK